jgi:hypothetical protein
MVAHLLPGGRSALVAASEFDGVAVDARAGIVLSAHSGRSPRPDGRLPFRQELHKHGLVAGSVLLRTTTSSRRRRVAETPGLREEATGADKDSVGVVPRSVHMHRHAVVCSTPMTQQIPAAFAFAQEEPSGSRPATGLRWPRLTGVRRR